MSPPFQNQPRAATRISDSGTGQTASSATSKPRIPTEDRLDRIENTEQLKRYRETFPNLILTNFLEFQPVPKWRAR